MKHKHRYLYMTFILTLLSIITFYMSRDKSPSGIEGGCDSCKAKAILWVDYTRGKEIPNGAVVKNIKVYAEVSPFGKVKIIAYCKKQPMIVENYLAKRLEKYTVRKQVMEEHYVEPGKQYLLLRYVEDWIK